jgi:uncharacterized protein (DUF1501 family)
MFASLASRWLPSVHYSSYAAQSTGGSRDIIVTVFLRGGADGLALCAPWKDNAYPTYRRATQVFAPTNTDPFRKAIDLDGFFGLPQSMAPLAPLYQAKYLLLVHQVGSTTPNATRSHFDAQQFLEVGKEDKQLWVGWMGRHLSSVTAATPGAVLRAIALSGQMPLLLTGAPSATALSDLINFSLPGNSATVSKRLDWLTKAYTTADKPLSNAASNAVKTINVLQQINYANYRPATGVTYNPPVVSTLANGSTVSSSLPWNVSDFGESLKATAALLKANVGIEAVHLDYGGWDMHSYANLFEARNNGNPDFGSGFWQLRSLAANLSAFFADMDSVKLTGGKTMMDRITVVVVSEFGRTVNENGNNGTDHGQGGVMMFLGKNVNGGRVDRVWKPLGPNGIDTYGGLAVSLDYRLFLGELIERRLQNGAQLSTILPGYKKPASGWRGAFK